MIKKTFFAMALLALASTAAFAGDGGATSASFGFELGEYGSDFALGARFTSPYLWDVAAVRASGDILFCEPASWNPYGTARLGLVGASRVIAGFARLYGEGGILAVFAGTSVSGSPFALGGYGLFGFEFFTGEESPVSYFIEIGSSGSGFRADAAAGAPMTINGLRVSAGLNVYPFGRNGG